MPTRSDTRDFRLVIPGFRGKLYPYQKHGVARIEGFEGRALLGDEMGLGKTIQALAWLQLHPEVRPGLVVCPSSAKVHWEREILKWTTGMVPDLLEGRRSREPAGNVWIINYDILWGWRNVLLGKGIQAIVIDECFPYDTKVLTEKGPISIGKIVQEKMPIKVISWDPVKKFFTLCNILRYISQPYNGQMIKIHHSGGNIVCTPNHKIWVEHEGQTTYSEASKLESGDLLRGMQSAIQSQGEDMEHSFLWNLLCCQMEDETKNPRTKTKTSRHSLRDGKEDMENQFTISGKVQCPYVGVECTTLLSEQSNEGLYKMVNRKPGICPAISHWRKRTDNSTTENSFTSPRELAYGICCAYTKVERDLSHGSLCFPSRYCSSVFEVDYRSGWGDTLHQETTEYRQIQNKSSQLFRVDHIEILEQRNSGGSPNDSSDRTGESTVYNLEVEDFHNYLANGIIVSNCHKTKNQKARRTKAVLQLSVGVPHFLALSGTPIINRPYELWTSISILRPELFGYFEYCQQYCDMKQDKFGYTDLSGASNTEDLHRILVKHMFIRRLKVDVLPNLPRKVRTVIPLSLEAGNEYHAANRDFMAWLKNTDPDSVEAASKAEALVKISKLKQLLFLGKVKQAIEWIQDALEQISKLVVFCIHREAVKLVAGAFPPGSCVRISGETSSRDRTVAIDSFQTSPEVHLFIGTIKAAGEAITLTAASNVVFLELDWTPAAHDQAEDRVHRIGQKANSVNAWYLIAQNTIEEDIVQLLDDKRKVLREVLDGRKADPEGMLGELLKRIRRRKA